MAKKEEIDLQRTKYSRLSESDLHQIEQILGYTPSELEKTLFRVLWSEKISRKATRVWLDKLLREGKDVVADQSSGEFFLDLGQDQLAFLSVNSENHLSAYSPYLGAANAVQNSLRRVLSKAARPVALLNSLRFGNPEYEKTRYFLWNIAKAVGDVAHELEVPIAGGEMFFNETYNDNPVVSIFAAGVMPRKVLTNQSAVGSSCPVYVFGAKTALVSSAPDEKLDASTRHQKQILSIMTRLQEKDCIATSQNIESGGLAAAAARITALRKHGLDIDLEKIPQTENLKHNELLLTETQGRVLFVGKKQKKKEIEKILSQHQLPYAQIGKITKEKQLNFSFQGEVVCTLPSEVLGSLRPEVQKKYYAPKNFVKDAEFNIDVIPEPSDLREIGLFLLTHKNIASKKPFVSRFFHTKENEPNVEPHYSDSAIVHLENPDTTLIFGADCNARYVDANPQQGAAIAVAEAARNIVCTGGKPTAVSLCLNFGDYNSPEVFWQFTEVIKGINKMCRRYELPVISTSVSFDNQSAKDENGQMIFPTPVVGMLGVLGKEDKTMSLNFKRKGDMIFLVGESYNDISSSLYLKSYHRVRKSPPPKFNMHKAFELQRLVLELIRRGLINSAHDVSNGGVFVTLVEAGMSGLLGFDITTDAEVREDAFLFGEAQNRIVVSVSPEAETDFIDFMMAENFPFFTLGHVTKGEVRIDDFSWGFISDMKAMHENSLSNMINNGKK